MPLSENEQRILDELEKQLRSDDPTLADAFSEPSPRPRSIDTKRLAVGAGGVVLGLAALVFAVWSHTIWLGVLAFVLMVASATYGLSASRPEKPHPHDPRHQHPAFGHGVRGGGRRPKQSGFMRAMQERWDRRDGERR